jgi:rsbT co-antagonist protein RsbR
MKNEAVKIIKAKKRYILEQWFQNQIENEGLREELITNEDQRIQSEELLNSFAASIGDSNFGNFQSRDFEKVEEILSGIAIARAKKGFSPRETGTYILSLKTALLKTLSEEIKDPSVLYTESMRINTLLDNFSMITFETFIKGREDVILRQTDEIAEISTPVIKIWDGILAIPIIGTLDSSRTQIVMESLLQEIVETSSSIAILDISGVPAIDTLVAQHLIKTVSATRLMGAECIISGIRPEIAQTVVHLGIDLSDIVTKSTLASALKTAFGMLELEVRKKATPKIV